MPTASRRKPAPKFTRAKRRTGEVKQRRPSRAHLLILECDSTKLAADGLNLGTGFAHLTQKMFSQKRVVLVKTSSEDKLKEDLSAVFKRQGRFRSILVVGHSNAVELQLTSDKRYSWTAVGNWLQIFEPEFLFLAACKAGGSEAVRDLFYPIKTLRYVYASPVTLYKGQTPPLAVLILMLLMNGRIDEDQAGGLRLAHYVLTGGELFRWTRGELGPGQELKGRLWDCVAAAFNFGSWNLLETLLPGEGRGIIARHSPGPGQCPGPSQGRHSSGISGGGADRDPLKRTFSIVGNGGAGSLARKPTVKPAYPARTQPKPAEKVFELVHGAPCSRRYPESSR